MLTKILPCTPCRRTVYQSTSCFINSNRGYSFHEDKPSGYKMEIGRIHPLDLAKSKLHEGQSFYNELVGTNEVVAAQTKVIEIQDQLQLAQERRRYVLRELTLLRHKMQDIQVELPKAVLDEPRYMELTQEMLDIVAREKAENVALRNLDLEEQDLFAHLAEAVKTSHEKERTHATNVRYWSIIGSGALALVGLIGTTINYFYRNAQMKANSKKLDNMENALETVVDYVITKKEIEGKETEGWGSYLKRCTVRVYRFIIPSNDK